MAAADSALGLAMALDRQGNRTWSPSEKFAAFFFGSLTTGELDRILSVPVPTTPATR